MAAPVIDPRTSVLSAVVGQPFRFQPAATNTPTSWACAGLFPGLSINTTSGLISGTPTASGYANLILEATNADGTGELIVPMGVAKSATIGSSSAAPLLVELNTGVLTGPGVGLRDGDPGTDLALPGGEQFALRVGEERVFSVKFVSGGNARALALGALSVSVASDALFPVDSAETLTLTDGTLTQVGSGEEARYEIGLEATTADFGDLLPDADSTQVQGLRFRARMQLSILEDVGGTVVTRVRYTAPFWIRVEA